MTKPRNWTQTQAASFGKPPPPPPRPAPSSLSPQMARSLGWSWGRRPRVACGADPGDTPLGFRTEVPTGGATSPPVAGQLLRVRPQCAPCGLAPCVTGSGEMT